MFLIFYSLSYSLNILPIDLSLQFLFLSIFITQLRSFPNFCCWGQIVMAFVYQLGFTFLSFKLLYNQVRLTAMTINSRKKSFMLIEFFNFLRGLLRSLPFSFQEAKNISLFRHLLRSIRPKQRHCHMQLFSQTHKSLFLSIPTFCGKNSSVRIVRTVSFFSFIILSQCPYPFQIILSAIHTSIPGINFLTEFQQISIFFLVGFGFLRGDEYKASPVLILRRVTKIRCGYI